MNFFSDGQIELRNCDMFDSDGFESLRDKSVSAIITDLPYGVLNKRNTWDCPVDLDRFWREVKRVRKSNAPTVTTALQPFTSYLILSNVSEFKYCWVWEKSKATGYLNSRKQPMRAHEDIVVFYNQQCIYNPQKLQGKPYYRGLVKHNEEQYGEQVTTTVHNEDGLRFPRSVIYFTTAEFEGKHHPTQKPTALFEYLIKTYTNEGDLVLDPCYGSATTAIACLNTNRRFIGFEKEEKFYENAILRLIKSQK